MSRTLRNRAIVIPAISVLICGVGWRPDLLAHVFSLIPEFPEVDESSDGYRRYGVQCLDPLHLYQMGD